jgi:hypothetical protein
MPKNSKVREIPLPNGATLFVKDNEAGGRTYISDEVPCGVIVWDTCLVNESSLIAAMHVENVILFEEANRGRDVKPPVAELTKKMLEIT